ncbi:MAG TPA: YtxH domain-containing protein [Polyangia bacterium]
MKLQDLKDISKEDALAAIGLAIKPSPGQWLAGTLSVFGFGVIVGAGVALLLAPRTGRELRDDLSEKVRTLREKTAQRMGSNASEPAIT